MKLVSSSQNSHLEHLFRHSVYTAFLYKPRAPVMGVDEFDSTPNRLTRQEHSIKAELDIFGICPEPTNAKEDYARFRFLDLDKPLFMQLWRGNFSKEFYLEQVHRPRSHIRRESALVFGNFLEPITWTPLWIVVVVWSLIGAYEAATAIKGFGSLSLLTSYFLIGLFLWTFTEYSLHRVLFHVYNSVMRP